MTNLTETTPAQIQMAVWQIALRRVDPRRPTSGGPRDRSAHVAYQREYQARRRLFGVRTQDGVAYYASRAKASRVRHVLRSARVWTFEAADMAAAGCSVIDVQLARIARVQAEIDLRVAS